MKPQDILFFIVFATLLFKHNPRHFAIAGLLCILVAMPLFAFWVFFTAERLIWYSAGFLLMTIFLELFQMRNSNN